MGGKSPNSVYFSVQLSTEEKDALDKAVTASGLNRNAFIRNFIRSLVHPK